MVERTATTPKPPSFRGLPTPDTTGWTATARAMTTLMRMMTAMRRWPTAETTAMTPTSTGIRGSSRTAATGWTRTAMRSWTVRMRTVPPTWSATKTAQMVSTTTMVRERRRVGCGLVLRQLWGSSGSAVSATAVPQWERLPWCAALFHCVVDRSRAGHHIASYGMVCESVLHPFLRLGHPIRFFVARNRVVQLPAARRVPRARSGALTLSGFPTWAGIRPF